MLQVGLHQGRVFIGKTALDRIHLANLKRQAVVTRPAPGWLNCPVAGSAVRPAGPAVRVKVSEAPILVRSWARKKYLMG